MVIGSRFMMLMFQFFILKKCLFFTLVLIISTWPRIVWIENVVTFSNVVLWRFRQSFQIIGKRTRLRNFKFSLGTLSSTLFTQHFTSRTGLELFEFNRTFDKISYFRLFLINVHIRYSFRMLRNFYVWKLLSLILLFCCFFNYFTGTNSTKLFLLITWQIWLLVKRIRRIKTSRRNLT